jgi:hypothetical protein
MTCVVGFDNQPIGFVTTDEDGDFDGPMTAVAAGGGGDFAFPQGTNLGFLNFVFISPPCDPGANQFSTGVSIP